MEQTNFLGIYPMADRVCGVLMTGKGQMTCAGCFIVRYDQQQQQDQSLLTGAAREIARQAGSFEQAAAAVRCALFTQYRLHSDFADIKQIENTVKYDAEDAAATDATNLAVAFEVNGQTDAGSDLTVYTASRQAMTDMLLDLQAGLLDPAIMEPDTTCFARALERTTPQILTKKTAVVMVSAGVCHILLPAKDGFAPHARTFVLGEAADPAAVLAGQLVLTVSVYSAADPIENIVLMESAGKISPAVLQDKISLNVQTINFAEALGLQPPVGAGPEDINGLAIAFGAAIAFAARGRKTDFRKDFMPYQGQKRLLQNSLRILSISLSVFLAVFAASFQLKAFRIKADIGRQQDKLVSEYRDAMYGKPPPRGTQISSKLRAELNKVRRVQQGLGPGDEQSVTSRLTFVLEAINNTPGNVDVQIEQISISERSITVIGNTNNRAGTRQLFDEVKKHPKLDVSSESLSISGARDKFTLTVKSRR